MEQLGFVVAMSQNELKRIYAATPESLRPYHPDFSTTGDILLRHREAYFTSGDKTSKGTMKLFWTLVPRPRIRFDIKLAGELAPKDYAEAGFLHATKRSPHRRVYITDIGPTFLKGALDSSETIHPRKIRHIEFYLPNFYETGAHWIRNSQGNKCYLGRILLKSGEWCTTVDTVSDYARLRENFKTGQPFAITHVCRLERVDHAQFNFEEGIEYLDLLRLFFSFARNARVVPVLPVGITNSQQNSEYWPNWWIDSWNKHPQWFHHGRELEELFPAFVRTFSEREESAEVFKKAFHLFWQANGTSLDADLILVQSVLELLAWFRFVKTGPSLLDFRKLRASDKIRLLLDKTGVSKTVPQTLEALHSSFDGDGPRAITDIRNSVVHIGENKAKHRKEPSVQEKHEALMLARWYCILAFLNMIDSNGTCFKRLQQTPPF